MCIRDRTDRDRHTQRQTDRQTDRDRHTERQTDRQPERERGMGGERDRQTDRHRQTDRDRHTQRQTDRQRQTHTEADRQTAREREREREASFFFFLFFSQFQILWAQRCRFVISQDGTAEKGRLVTCLIFFASHVGLGYDVIDTDFWAQNGNSRDEK